MGFIHRAELIRWGRGKRSGVREAFDDAGGIGLPRGDAAEGSVEDLSLRAYFLFFFRMRGGRIVRGWVFLVGEVDLGLDRGARDGFGFGGGFAGESVGLGYGDEI